LQHVQLSDLFFDGLEVGLDVFEDWSFEEDVLEGRTAFEVLLCEFYGLGWSGALVGENFLWRSETALFDFDGFRRVAGVLTAELDVLWKCLENAHLTDLLILIEFHSQGSRVFEAQIGQP
jgi:hypothetical protein